MTRIKFDADLIKRISLIQNIIKVQVKDCFETDDRTVVIVPEGSISRAIGKGGENVRKIERVLNRKIKIVEFNPKPLTFINNLIYPLKVLDAVEEDGILTLIPQDSKTRGYVIGRNAKNLRQTEKIVKRYFKITELRVK